MNRILEQLMNRTVAPYGLFPIPSWVGLGDPTMEEILERVSEANTPRIDPARAVEGRVAGRAGSTAPVAVPCARPSR